MTTSQELFSKEQQKEITIESLLIENRLLKEENLFLKRELKKLKELYLELKRDKFGKKAEKFVNEDQFGFVFNEVEQEASRQDPTEDTNAEEEEEVTVKSHTKKKREAIARHCRRIYHEKLFKWNCQSQSKKMSREMF